MKVTLVSKTELVCYQLNGMAHVCYTQWKMNSAIVSGHIHKEEFKKEFLDSFYPLEKREDNVEEVINLHQGGMSIQ